MRTLEAYIEPGLNMYEFSSDGIMVLDLDGKVVYTNSAICEMFGYEKSEVKGMTCAQLKHDPFFRFDRLLEELGSEEHIIRNSDCLDKNKNPIPTTVVYSLLRGMNNTPIGVFFGFRPKKIALPNGPDYFRSHITLLKALTTRNDELITVSDIQTRTSIYISSALEKMFGWDVRSYIEGGWALDISLTHPEDIKTMVESFLREVEKRNTNPYVLDHKPIHFEFRRRHRNGTWRWLRSETFVLERNADGTIRYLISFGRDVTEEKTTENTSTDRIISELLRENNIGNTSPATPMHGGQHGIALSRREIDVLRLIRNGSSAKEISMRLGLKVNTINSYKKTLFKKLDARNTVEALRIATEWRLI